MEGGSANGTEAHLYRWPQGTTFCWILDPIYCTSRMNQVFRFVDKKCLHTLISWW